MGSERATDGLVAAIANARVRIVLDRHQKDLSDRDVREHMAAVPDEVIERHAAGLESEAAFLRSFLRPASIRALVKEG